MPMILFIDDHTCGSHAVAHRLRACGYEVQMAPDAEEAPTLLRLYPIDAVVMDCHPEMPGRGTIAPALRRISPDVPIIMMSAFCGEPCGRLRYANACINKGDVTALPCALRMLLCSRAYGLYQSVAA
jgi:DNA-binding response OmpR family regulator